jgi:hypothetical protein
LPQRPFPKKTSWPCSSLADAPLGVQFALYVQLRSGREIQQFLKLGHDRGLNYARVSDLNVKGAESCMICHGEEGERRKFEGLGKLM